MQIIFKNIKIENFLSLGEVDLDLNDRGYVLIKGVNNNPEDAAGSNGTGKTSILEALVWCLTGTTMRGVKSNVTNMYAEGGCKVELTFSVDEDNYKVIRTRDHKEYGTTLKIYLNDKDVSGKALRDTEKLLDEYLPDLDINLIGSVIVLGQGLPQRFTNNTPSGRKEVLEKLSKSDFMIEDIKLKLCDRIIVLERNLRSVEDNILEKSSKIDLYKKQLVDINNKLEQYRAHPDWDDEINKLQKYLDEQTNIIKEVQSQKAIKQQELDELNNQITSLKLEYKDKEQELKQIRDSKNNPLDKLKIETSLRIDRLKKDISDAKSIKDICPTCGQKIPNVHVIDTTSMEEELVKLTQSLKEYAAEYQINTKECDAQIYNLRLEEEDKELNLGTKVLDIKKFLNEISQKETNYNQEYRDISAKISTLTYEKQTFENTYNSYVSSKNTIENDITGLEEEIRYSNNEKVELQNRINAVNKMLNIAKRDFRGYLLSNIIQFIDSKAREYCKEVFGTDKISFKLDGNNILISYNDKPYENLSGGERQKVDIIVQFSLRDMLCQFSNFSSNVLALDELFDNIDAIGCAKVVDLITNKIKDVDSIFIITHHSDIPIGADFTLTITKNQSGISYIE